MIENSQRNNGCERLEITSNSTRHEKWYRWTLNSELCDTANKIQISCTEEFSDPKCVHLGSGLVIIPSQIFYWLNLSKENLDFVCLDLQIMYLLCHLFDSSFAIHPEESKRFSIDTNHEVLSICGASRYTRINREGCTGQIMDGLYVCTVILVVYVGLQSHAHTIQLRIRFKPWEIDKQLLIPLLETLYLKIFLQKCIVSFYVFSYTRSNFFLISRLPFGVWFLHLWLPLHAGLVCLCCTHACTSEGRVPRWPSKLLRPNAELAKC